MSVSRAVGILIWFMTSVIASLMCGVLAAVLGESVATRLEWAGNGFFVVGSLGLAILLYLSSEAGGSSGPGRSG
ncbi:hypothetical protein [Streptomyces sp. bgisy082]|uniref:hypothetical protein n=1 Tax=Streptomyces sp. bgisy082 TaxID=3413776 RepID=UPI003D707D1F